MNADRDVIFVNPRSTLHSDPHLGCPEMDELSARSVGLVYQAASTAALDAAAITACRERLAPTGVWGMSFSGGMPEIQSKDHTGFSAWCVRGAMNADAY
jgi:hypothetical protein